MKIHWKFWSFAVVIVFVTVFLLKKKQDALFEQPLPAYKPNLNLPDPNLSSLFKGDPLASARPSTFNHLIGIDKDLSQVAQHNVDLFIGLNEKNFITKIEEIPMSRRFPIDEELNYQILWNGLNVGEAQLWTSKTDKHHQLKISCRVHTNNHPIIETVYPVDNLFESIINSRTGITISHVKDQNENRRKKKDLIEVNHLDGNVHYRKFKNGELRRDVTYQAPSDAVDPLAAIYQLRNISLDLTNKIHSMNILSNKRVAKLNLERRANTETIVPLGRFNCIVLKPDLNTEGLFDEPQDGSAYVYFEKNTGVIIKIDATLYPPIGRVTIELNRWNQGYLPQ